MQYSRGSSDSPDNLVYDSYLEMDIPFPNQDEAKLARLALTHNYSIYMIDLFFETLLGGHGVAKRSSPEEIASAYAHVAAYRTEQAFKRDITHRSQAHHALGDASSTGMGSALIILDLVLEELLAQSTAEASNDGKRKGYNYNFTFMSMALVHRSWTAPCQRALGRAFFLFTESSVECHKFRSLLCSPLFGSWTKSASFHFNGYDNRKPSRRRIAPHVNLNLREGLILGKVALKRYLGLEKLTLAFSSFHATEIPNAEAMLNCVGGLNQLQEFTIDVGGSFALLVRLCHVLPNLCRLRLLTLIAEGKDWDDGRASLMEQEPNLLVPPVTSELSPARTLRQFTFSLSGLNLFDIQPVLPIIEWIATPRPDLGYSLDHLTVYYHSLALLVGSGTAEPVLKAISPALTHLESLELHTSLVDKAPEQNNSRAIFERCKSLKRLRLCFIDGTCPQNFNVESTSCGPRSLTAIEVSRAHHPLRILGTRLCQFTLCKNPATTLA